MCLCVCEFLVYNCTKATPTDPAHSLWDGSLHVAVAESPHHAIEQKVLPHCQQVKQNVVLGTETEGVTDVVHLGPDVLSVHTGCPRGGFE